MVLFLFFLALTFVSSWQEEITEKSLNQMLDQLIEDTVLTTYSDENENNSRIIYIKSDNVTRRSHDNRLNTVHSSEFEDLEDLVHNLDKSKQNANYASNEAGHDITVHTFQFNDGDRIQSESETNLIHSHPEMIINKISYDVTEKTNEPIVETLRQANVKHLTNEEETEALHTLTKIIIKGIKTRSKMDMSRERELNNIQRSAYTHDDYYDNVINNVPLQYTDLLPRGKKILGILPKEYPKLHRIISRTRSTYLDPSLQLNRWGVNARRRPIMSILRPHNLNRIHFIPKPLSLLPKILYGRRHVFLRNYPG